MAATNVYADMAGLIKNYIKQEVDDYLNQSITVNNVTLTCDVYRVEDGSVLTNEVFTGCTENDANTQIIIGRTLSVAEGTTLTPPYRCKGLFIGSPGTFKNEGTISMTARGASAEGQNIALVDDYFISAVGGSGGTGDGSSPSGLSCGGGGGGGNNYKVTGGSAGSGGSGTSYSGGAGGGGNACGHTAGSGSSSGGAGGNGSVWASASYTYISCGGAGNPGGSGGPNAYSTSAAGSIGTGGLLVIFSDVLNQHGILKSQGSAGGGSMAETHVGGGGGSGGGCIVLLSKVPNITGTYNVNGGAGGVTQNKAFAYSAAVNGKNGGNGKYQELTVYDMEISEPTELTLGITLNEWVDDIEPADGRLLGLMDDDELYYEYGGKRHRSSKGHNIEDEEGTVVPRRNSMVIQDPLTVADDSTEEKTMIGIDASGELDMTAFIPPSQLSPGVNQIGMLEDVEIISPTDGQGLMYDGSAQKWVNGASGLHEYSTTEKVVGKWVDGRPIYERTFIGVLPTISTSSEVVSIIESMPNADYTVISTEGSVSWETSSSHRGTVITPWCAGSSNYICFHQYSNNFTLVSCGTHFSGASYRGTVKYVKTADTPTQT